ncbi:MAG: DUF1499 domain-containing protein [Rhodospirillaceae bacterium]|jgi:uncharacterized protein (DUF1499 family)|nr:DUF1499 domain-containing protein [Rhodospirillaceae bacterium]
MREISLNKRLATTIKALLALLILMALLVGVMGREKSLEVVFGAFEVGVVDFPSLTLTAKPNQFLVCPAGFCGATPHMISPVFAYPVDILRQRWMAMLAAQPRIEAGAADEGGMQFDFIQRTKLMHYPDSITVRFIPLADGQSTLAIYSRSHYGRSDFGVNQARILSWFGFLEQY